MIVTKNWLKEFVNLDGVEAKQIADAFTFSGFEIENYKDRSEKLNHVVVGKIEKIIKHPNADKLLICSISDGKQIHQIITHATNMKEGDLVPVALEGADLANGVKIKPTNMRGVDSCGMMCAGEELGIDNSVYQGAETDGIMIIDPNDASVGQPVASFLGLDDVVFDVNVLANRPDCQSVMGLAKELACALDRKFVYNQEQIDYVESTMPFSIENVCDDCLYYVAKIVKDVKIQPSPKWMQNRLKSVGINPINNVVDISNYVLWETGQPMHAYDYKMIDGNKIIVRHAKDGETAKLLNEQEYKLNENNIVITSENNILGLAGVMGGSDFSINDNTTDIVLESATFKKESIRKTARGFGLRTDASARYEKGVEPVSCEIGLTRALSLFKKLGIGKIEKTTYRSAELSFENKIKTFDYSRIISWLGIDIPADKSLEILNKLDIKSSTSGNCLKCEIPAIRTDINNFSDIAEEIIRYYGINKVPSSNSYHSANISGGYEKIVKKTIEIKDVMLATGASEVKTFGFYNPENLNKVEIAENSELRTKIVKIRNPLNVYLSVMRTEMLSSLLEVVKYNLNHKNNDFSIFEIGKTFFAKSENEIPEERNVLAYMSAEEKTDFYAVKSIVELLALKLGLSFSYKQIKVEGLHPNIAAEIIWANKKVGAIGKVHPRVLNNFEINKDIFYFELYIDVFPDKKVKKVKPPAKYPCSVRDLAVVVDENTPVGNLIEQVKKSAGDVCEDVELFDVYTGKQVAAGEKSVAVKLVFRKLDGTLEQAEINEKVDKVLNDLNLKFGAKLREL